MYPIRRWWILLLGFFCTVSALAEEPGKLLERTRLAESKALSLLAEHYRFEESLLQPDGDRIVVFLTIPHGKSIIVDQVSLKLMATRSAHLPILPMNCSSFSAAPRKCSMPAGSQRDSIACVWT